MVLVQNVESSMKSNGGKGWDRTNLSGFSDQHIDHSCFLSVYNPPTFHDLFISEGDIIEYTAKILPVLPSLPIKYMPAFGQKAASTQAMSCLPESNNNLTCCFINMVEVSGLAPASKDYRSFALLLELCLYKLEPSTGVAPVTSTLQKLRSAV